MKTPFALVVFISCYVMLMFTDRSFASDDGYFPITDDKGNVVSKICLQPPVSENCVCASVYKTDAGELVCGKKFKFSIAVPENWITDCCSSRKDGFSAVVMYPKDHTWRNSPLIAYALSRPKTKDISTVEDQVQDTLASYHSNGSPDIVSERAETFSTGSGKSAQVYFYKGDKWGNFEAVAYVDEPEAICFVVFSAKNRDILDAALPTMSETLKSYHFLGSHKGAIEKLR